MWTHARSFSLTPTPFLSTTHGRTLFSFSLSRPLFHSLALAQISNNGHRLATFMSVANNGTMGGELTALAVFSLEPETRGQCLFKKVLCRCYGMVSLNGQVVAFHILSCHIISFLQTLGPKAVGVAFSPLDNYVAVGLAAQRLIVHPSAAQVRKRLF